MRVSGGRWRARNVYIDVICVVKIWTETPFGQEWGGNFSGILESGKTNFSGYFFANLLGSQPRDESVDLFAHLLRLEVAHLLRRVHGHVLGLVVALGLARHPLAVVRSARLERDLLADGVGKCPVHGLLDGAADGPAQVLLLATHASGPVASQRLLALFHAVLDVLHHGRLLVLGHARGLVLGLTHLIGNLEFHQEKYFLQTIISRLPLRI